MPGAGGTCAGAGGVDRATHAPAGRGYYVRYDHSNVLNEEQTLCGQDVPYGLRAFCTVPYGMFSRCPACRDAEENLRALLALTGEGEPTDAFERLNDNLFPSTYPTLDWLRKRSTK